MRDLMAAGRFSGLPCDRLTCLPNTHNTHHPPKLFMSTLILILSQAGTRNDMRLRDKRRCSDPQTRVDGVSRHLLTPATYREFIFMSTLIFSRGTLLTHWRSRLLAADAKSMNGGNPMLSTQPITKTLANSTHAARRIAARIASAFVPTEHLAPLTHEALCYGCMVGIVMPLPHDIAPCDRGHGVRELRLNGDSTPTRQLHDPVQLQCAGTST